MRKLMSLKGQVSLELALLFAVVVAALIAMIPLIGRHVKGNAFNQSQSISQMPWGDGAEYNISGNSNALVNADSNGTNTDSKSDTDINFSIGDVGGEE